MTAALRHRFDKPSFFDWLQRQDRRHELVDGQPILLPRVTRNHNQITTNIVAALGTRVDRTRFALHAGRFAVETGERSIRFPDAMAEPAGADGHGRSTEQAILLVEISSRPSAHSDFNEKLIEYSRLPICDTYLICDQDKPLVWQWTRREGLWPSEPRKIEGLEGAIDLRALDCVLPLREVYFGIELDVAAGRGNAG